MKSIDNVGVTFVNTVVGSGVLNGVVNITLGVLQFTPGDNDKIEPDMVTASRLRMDQVCARQLYDSLGKLLELIDKAPEQKAVNGAAEHTAEAAKPH